MKVRELLQAPRRLLMKRENPDLFRVQRGLTVGDMQFSAIGNRFLLDRPVRLQVQLAPWEHHNEHLTISRNQCLALNEMAKKICE